MIYTIAGRDVGLTIRDRLSDYDATPTFEDDELSRHLSWAVSDYSNYRPYTGYYSFDTVATVQSYPIPSDAITIVNHNYTNMGDLTFLNANQLDWIYFTGQMRDDASRYERGALMSRWQDLTVGQVQIVQNSWVWLFPIPSGAFSVLLQYETVHKLVGNDFPTIPSSDIEIIVNLTVVRCLDIELDEMLRQGDWTAGQSQVKRNHEALNRRIGRLRDQAYGRLTGQSVFMTQ